MTAKEVLAELKRTGTAQNRKVYARHGIGEKMFGVSFADLGKLKKKIKLDHELAKQLWASGNHDAQVLATMIVEPEKMDDSLLESWAKNLSNYVIADMFSRTASQSTLACKKVLQWTKSAEEYVGQAGWNLLAHLAMDNQDLPDSYFEIYLDVIERKIHKSKNRVRHAMNSALIAIGIRNAALEKAALAAAAKIGKVDVDHGETNCKTPDAASYIRKARPRNK